MVSGMHSVRAVHSYTSSKYGFLAITALLEFLKLQIAVNCTLMGSQPMTYLTDVFVAAAYERGKHCSALLNPSLLHAFCVSAAHGPVEPFGETIILLNF